MNTSNGNNGTNLRQVVRDNLEFAKENGAFEVGEQLFEATPQEIADDMVTYASDVEQHDAKDILPYVEEWVKEQENKK